MATAAEIKIRDIFRKYDVPMTTGQGGNIWRVQGQPVIAHKALEEIAAKAEIYFDPMNIILATDTHAVIGAQGFFYGREDRPQWSIGEARIMMGEGMPGNYKVSGKQAAYPYAMAEKRAKDRVILKLLDLRAYSDQEADDFQDKSKREAFTDDEEPAKPAEAVTSVPVGTDLPMERLLRDIEKPQENTDGSLIKIARVLQTLKDGRAIDKFLAQENTKKARASISAGQASLLLQFINMRRGMVPLDPPEQAPAPAAAEPPRQETKKPSLQDQMRSLGDFLKGVQDPGIIEPYVDQWLEENLPGGVEAWEGTSQVFKAAVREQEKIRRAELEAAK